MDVIGTKPTHKHFFFSCEDHPAETLVTCLLMYKIIYEIRNNNFLNDYPSLWSYQSNFMLVTEITLGLLLQ